ncbi:MAG: hypothetical protein ABIT01_20070 [Thermoanaerobaculia bacterium]
MSPAVRRLLLRLPLAAAAATALWLLGGAELYQSIVTSVTETSIRLFERPRVTFLTYDKGFVTIHRTDFSSEDDSPVVNPSSLTGNVVILLALLWGATGFGRKIGFWWQAAGLAFLFVTHVTHLALTIETLYATQLGEWSLVHYPRWQRELLGTSRYLFDILLIYALPFLIWGALSGFPVKAPAATEEASPKPAPRPRWKKQK